VPASTPELSDFLMFKNKLLSSTINPSPTQYPKVIIGDVLIPLL
jgi:hypothetical protein